MQTLAFAALEYPKFVVLEYLARYQWYLPWYSTMVLEYSRILVLRAGVVA